MSPSTKSRYIYEINISLSYIIYIYFLKIIIGNKSGYDKKTYIYIWNTHACPYIYIYNQWSSRVFDMAFDRTECLIYSNTGLIKFYRMNIPTKYAEITN